MTERVVQALSAVSSIYLVEKDGGYECRKCLLIALDCSEIAKLPSLASALDHLDEHAKRQRGENGSKDAIWKLEACALCRGSGMTNPGKADRCRECGGTGKNKAGRDRGVRRGVIVE